MKTHSLVMLTALTLGGCAYNQAPVVDRSGVSEAQYQDDLAYCEHYALQVDKREASGVAAQNSAVVGAGIGGVSGLLEDGIGGAVVGALVGGLVGGGIGATEGAVSATEVQARVLRNCLVEMGYVVYDQER